MKKHNILLIDDDEVSTFFVQHKLSELEGVGDIFLAVDGQDALDKLKGYYSQGLTIDLILLDLNMPVMNGFEFLDIYKTTFAVSNRDTNVYVVTSSSHSKDSDRAKEYSCVAGYIDKSVLIDRVTSILNSI